MNAEWATVRLPTQADIDQLQDPAEIRAARRAGERTWQDWERGERTIAASAREFFLIKISAGKC